MQETVCSPWGIVFLGYRALSCAVVKHGRRQGDELRGSTANQLKEISEKREEDGAVTGEKDYEGLSVKPGEDRLMNALNKVIRIGIRALAILMTFVIIWGIGDVVWVIYRHVVEPPFMILKMADILETFGAFLAVLIAVEIFLNITLYLRDDIIHVKLVVATALMAIARKVIVFDFSEISYQHVMATGMVVLALGITYWLIAKRERTEPHQD